MRFLTASVGNPGRIRFTAYIQLYGDQPYGDNTGLGGIIGGDYAPEFAVYSDWLTIPVLTNRQS